MAMPSPLIDTRAGPIRLGRIPSGNGAVPVTAMAELEDWAGSAVEVDGRACHVGGAI